MRKHWNVSSSFLYVFLSCGRMLVSFHGGKLSSSSNGSSCALDSFHYYRIIIIIEPCPLILLPLSSGSLFSLFTLDLIDLMHQPNAGCISKSLIIINSKCTYCPPRCRFACPTTGYTYARISSGITFLLHPPMSVSFYLSLMTFHLPSFVN